MTAYSISSDWTYSHLDSDLSPFILFDAEENTYP